MVDCVKRLDEVYEDDEDFEAVLFPELERSFEGEDGVITSFILETAILGFQVIIANVGIHTVSYDMDEDFIYVIEKIDMAPVGRVGGVPFFE